MLRALALALLLALSTGAHAQALAKATFAAGCFWCTEEAFDKLPGVTATISGYMGGNTKNPTYEQISTGRTLHAEVVQVTYDPAKVSYERLLEHFWVNHDPTVMDRQFCDVGSQYRPTIYYHTPAQKLEAEASKVKVAKTKTFSNELYTPILPAEAFWPAEEYHQDYYKKNPRRYKFYVTGCGRYRRLEALWGKR